MKKSLKYIVILAVILVAGAIFYNKVYIPKSTYERVTATQGDLDLTIFGIGNVGAKEIYALNSLTATKIKSINADEGKWVKKGDLLVVMDAVDLPQLIEEAKIAVQKAQMEVTASVKDLDAQYAQKDLASITYKRYAKLKEQSFASEAEYDKAKADLDAINAQIAATKAHIDSAKHEVIRAQKSVEALQTKLSRYKIYAPVDGYVISKDADVGESVIPTQPILKIVNAKDVWIRAYIDERISGAIKVGQKADITLRSQSNKKFAGYVKRIVAQSDAITQEREVDVAFEKLPLPFYINEQAEVLIAIKTLKNVTKVPLNAVVHKDTQSGVWIDENSQAHFKKVKILGVDEKMAAVADLSPNAVLILPAKNKKPLFEGSKVH